ncbi:MAG: asparagine synthase-related protein [Desulfobacterales bacterium]|nr:asparagine synthase-related protein [Desulfobacterales bacterium]
MKELLKDNIKLCVDERPFAISLSGGTDSLCMLFSCEELGILPETAYTYVVSGGSKDLEMSEKVCEHYKIPLVVAEIPKNLVTLEVDVLKIIGDGIRGKVNIQCMHGHYYVAPLVKEKIILNGSGVDGLYGSYRSQILGGCRKDKRLFDKSRRDHLANPNDDAMRYQSELFLKYGIEVAYPYRCENIISYLMKLNWEEINNPRAKWVIVKEFPQFERFEVYRPRGSQQIVAGTRSLHDSLLADSSFNFRGRRRVIDLYKDLAERKSTAERKGFSLKK